MFVVSLVAIMSERERVGPISRLLENRLFRSFLISPYSEPFMVLE